MYATVNETWHLDIGGRSRSVTLRNEEGLMKDRITLTVDGQQLVSHAYTMGNNSLIFMLDGIQLELRWLNDAFAQRFGVAILQDGVVLASTGEEISSAAKSVVASDVAMSWGITFEKPHVVRVLYRERALGDTLSVAVDGEQVHQATLTGSGSTEFTVDGRALEARWHHEMVGMFRQALTAIAIMHEGRVLAHIGPLASLGITQLAPPTGVRAIDDLELDPGVTEDATPIATEDFPIDNRAGAADVATTETVSHTASNEVTVGAGLEGTAELGVDVLKVLQASLSAKLGLTLGHAFGESVTRSRSIELRVPPGNYLVHRVTWMQERRRGRFKAIVDGRPCEFPFEAVFGLSYRIDVLVGKDTESL